jgi:hypothetical protein
LAPRTYRPAEAYGDAHANNATRLIGYPAKRLRVGDFWIIFEESEPEIIVPCAPARRGLRQLRKALLYLHMQPNRGIRVLLYTF